MATLIQVMDTLAKTTTSALYPLGPETVTAVAPCNLTNDPKGVAVIQPPNIKIMRGWPLPQDLDAMSTAAQRYAIVSVFPRPNTGKRTTRFLRRWQTLVPPTRGTVVSASGYTVRISTVNPGENIIVKCGRMANFGASIGANDTPASVAAALAAKIAVRYPGTAAIDDAITIAGQPGIVSVRASSSGIIAREIRRQEEQFQVTVWAPTVEIRAAVSAIVDPALSAIDFLEFDDGSAGRMLFTTEVLSDDKQRETNYQHHLIYTIDYPTIETRGSSEVGSFGVQTTALDQSETIQT